MLVAAYVTLGGFIPLNREIMPIGIFIRMAEVRHCQPRDKRGCANWRCGWLSCARVARVAATIAGFPHRSMAAHGEPHVARQDIESSTRLTKCANLRIFLGTAAPHHRQFGSDLRSLAFGQMPAIQVEGDDEDDGVAPSPLIDDGAAALHWSLRLDALIG